MKFICMPCAQPALEAAAGDLAPACWETPVPDVVVAQQIYLTVLPTSAPVAQTY